MSPVHPGEARGIIRSLKAGGGLLQQVVQWGKKSGCQHGGWRSDPWVGTIPLEEGMATHCSLLAWSIPTDRGAWRATVLGVAEEWDRTE